MYASRLNQPALLPLSRCHLYATPDTCCTWRSRTMHGEDAFVAFFCKISRNTINQHSGLLSQQKREKNERCRELIFWTSFPTPCVSLYTFTLRSFCRPCSGMKPWSTSWHTTTFALKHTGTTGCAIILFLHTWRYLKVAKKNIATYRYGKNLMVSPVSFLYRQQKRS